METLIEFRDASILNGENQVVYNFNMTVAKGDFVYIVGKVGTGKTSIIRTMIAENRLGSGRGIVCGYDLSTIRSRDIPYLRRKTGVVFQDFQLLMDRSVEDNLAFVLRSTGWRDNIEILARINQVLNLVGMSDKSHKMPHQLSGGEQQRIAIARALLNEPELILADEPTGNLDGETATGIMELLRQLNEKRGTAVIMVTHNRSLCESFPGRVFHCINESCEEIPAAE
ncbi:MAG: ATP-binding cassette domain-containing protein [Bacteroidales bacterium]|nr:ATP-binding cassette domain-containing protein [Bacteroidales bacterium]